MSGALFLQHLVTAVSNHALHELDVQPPGAEQSGAVPLSGGAEGTPAGDGGGQHMLQQHPETQVAQGQKLQQPRPTQLPLHKQPAQPSPSRPRPPSAPGSTHSEGDVACRNAGDPAHTLQRHLGLYWHWTAGSKGAARVGRVSHAVTCTAGHIAKAVARRVACASCLCARSRARAACPHASPHARPDSAR